jgi:hypothetical protein
LVGFGIFLVGVGFIFILVLYAWEGKQSQLLQMMADVLDVRLESHHLAAANRTGVSRVARRRPSAECRCRVKLLLRGTRHV